MRAPSDSFRILLESKRYIGIVPARKKKVFRMTREVRAISRERVGTVPPGRPIEPKSLRKKPKYKKPLEPEGE
jgi:hypothetical protein